MQHKKAKKNLPLKKNDSSPPQWLHFQGLDIKPNWLSINEKHKKAKTYLEKNLPLKRSDSSPPQWLLSQGPSCDWSKVEKSKQDTELLI